MQAGAFAVLLEMVPAEVAGEVTRTLDVPTIGIGAGHHGLNTGRVPRFVKRYADLHAVLLRAAASYAGEVRDGTFPGPEHTFGQENP